MDPSDTAGREPDKGQETSLGSGGQGVTEEVYARGDEGLNSEDKEEAINPGH